MSNKLNTSFVITTVGSSHLTDCVESLLERLVNESDYEIVVVNNGYSKVVGLPDSIKVVETASKYVSFAYSCNVGVKESSEEYENLCIMHDDAHFTEQTDVPLMLETLNEPSVGLVSSKGVSKLGLTSSTFMFLNRVDKGKVDFAQKWIGWHKRASKINTKARVLSVGSGLWVLKKSTWNDIGGLDESFKPCLFEDADFCFKLGGKGLSVVYLPESEFVHTTKVSIPQEAEIITIISTRNLQKIADKYASTISGILEVGDKVEGNTTSGG